MRDVRLGLGICLLLYIGTPASSSASGKLEEFGVLLKSTTFWIGTPEEEGAMAYLKIPQGTKVKILSEEGKYYRINHKDLIGYVESKSVRKVIPGSEDPSPTVSKPAPPAHEKPKTVKPSLPSSSGTGYYRVMDRTSLREGPDSDATVLLRLPEGDRVEVLESSGKYWWKVKYKTTTGWAKAALLREE
ncbi:MAG: SH3 domain-containing protein [Saprospirales bacterium]|nr:SH3 domain-containing protein [Saprospirales bacterium]